MTQASAQTAVHPPDEVSEETDAPLYGMIGEFDDVTAVVKAARAARQAGYRHMDVHSPFPVHGVDEAIGIKPTILPWIVLGCGLLGTFSALFLTIFTMGNWTLDIPGLPGVPDLQPFPFMISGKPYNSLPDWIAITFELTILFAAFGATLGMYLLNKLPMLFHPLMRSDRFRRVTNDRFFLAIEASDRHFDVTHTAKFMTNQGALSTEVIRE